MNRETVENGLKRGMGLLDATMMVVGIQIGSGIFIVSAESSRLVGAPGWLLMAWALAGWMTLSGSQCCAELAAMMPRAGGQYVFLREAYGSTVAFLYGWALLLIIQTGTIAAVAVAFASFAGVLVKWVSGSNYIVAPIAFGRYAISLSTQQLVAIVAIVLLTAANTRGVRTGALIQTSLTILKTAAVIGLIGLGLTLGWNRHSAAFTSSWWHPLANGSTMGEARPNFHVSEPLALAMLLGLAMVGPLFAQSAWNNVTFAGGEVRDPGKALPRALLMGTAIVVAIYLLTNLAYVVTLPLGGIQHAPQDRVGTAMMDAIFGPLGGAIMAGVIVISTFSSCNGLVLAGARVYYAMARDALFFARAGVLNARQVPAAALAMQCVWASLLTLPRTVSVSAGGVVTYGNVYTQLLEYIIAAELVFYGLMVAAVIRLRKKAPQTERPYRTVGYPATPWMYIILSVALVVDLFFLAPATAGIGFLLVLSGIPIYFLWRGKSEPLA